MHLIELDSLTFLTPKTKKNTFPHDLLLIKKFIRLNLILLSFLTIVIINFQYKQIAIKNVRWELLKQTFQMQ